VRSRRTSRTEDTRERIPTVRRSETTLDVENRGRRTFLCSGETKRHDDDDDNDDDDSLSLSLFFSIFHFFVPSFPNAPFSRVLSRSFLFAPFCARLCTRYTRALLSFSLSLPSLSLSFFHSFSLSLSLSLSLPSRFASAMRAIARSVGN